MQIAGMICEYNPFHLGHLALVEETRRQGATHIAAVMSGNYVQRGEPALLEKRMRAKQALRCGVDLVVELPLPWAMSTAETFARGGVFLLDCLGADVISFGSECGNAALLIKAAKDLLCKALLSQSSPMRVFTMQRVGASHDSFTSDAETASASYIRSLAAGGMDFAPYMPVPAAEILQAELDAGHAPASLERMERAILAKLRTMEPEAFVCLPDISEGLENRLYAAARKAASLEELYALVKTKRYPLARIRRLVLSAFLGVTNALTQSFPPYVRILGMNPRGAEILHVSKMTTKRPIIANSSDILSLDNIAQNVIELESQSTDVYSLFLPNPSPCGLEWTAGICKVWDNM